VKVCIITGTPVDSILKRDSGGALRIHFIAKYLSKKVKRITIVAQSDQFRLERFDNVTIIGVPIPSLLLRFTKKFFLRKFLETTVLDYAIYFILEANPSFLNISRSLIKCSDAVIIAGSRFQILPIIYSKMHRKIVVFDLFGSSLLLLTRKFGELLRIPFRMLRLIICSIGELITAKLSDYVVVSSPQDKFALIKLMGKEPTRVHIIPDGVDLSFMQHLEHYETLAKEIRQKTFLEKKMLISFIGNLRSIPNVYAVKEIIDRIIPSLRSKYSNLRFHFLVIGPYKFLPRRFLKCSHVTFTGYVEDPIPYLMASDICVAPLTQGTGTKTKVILYMACGKPIITTSIGAEGLGLDHGKDAIVCEVERMADYIAKLAFDKNLRQALGKAAKTKAKDFDWVKRADHFYALLKDIVKYQGEENP